MAENENENKKNDPGFELYEILELHKVVDRREADLAAATKDVSEIQDKLKAAKERKSESQKAYNEALDQLLDRIDRSREPELPFPDLPPGIGPAGPPKEE